MAKRTNSPTNARVLKGKYSRVKRAAFHRLSRWQWTLHLSSKRQLLAKAQLTRSLDYRKVIRTKLVGCRMCSVHLESTYLISWSCNKSSFKRWPCPIKSTWNLNSSLLSWIIPNSKVCKGALIIIVQRFHTMITTICIHLNQWELHQISGLILEDEL